MARLSGRAADVEPSLPTFDGGQLTNIGGRQTDICPHEDDPSWRL